MDGKALLSRTARTRTVVIAVLAVALVGGLGAFAYSARHKDVTLSVDGKVERIQVVGDTVADVLEGQGIDIDGHDAVAPSLGSEVRDGSRIAVRHGRPLDLTVDGVGERYWVTATSVDAALAQIGHRFTDADLSASRSAPIGRDGLDLTVRTAKDVTLVDGTKKSERVTTALTVGAALRDLNVKYDKSDKVRPAVDTGIDDGSRIRVVRVDHRTRKVEVDVPNETVVRYDDSMLEGRERVRRPGHDGVRVDTYKVVLVNGERRRRTRVDTRVRTRAVDRVEMHGTKERPEPKPQSQPEREPQAEREPEPRPKSKPDSKPDPQPAPKRAPEPEPDTGISSAPCPSGSQVEDGLTSNAVSVHRAVCARFPGVGSYGGLRPGDDGEHGQGRALDIIVSDSSLGDAIAAWVRANHQALGASEVLWSQRIWTVERSSEGWRPMEDRGSATANHYDHVHVTVY